MAIWPSPADCTGHSSLEALLSTSPVQVWHPSQVRQEPETIAAVRAFLHTLSMLLRPQLQMQVCSAPSALLRKLMRDNNGLAHGSLCSVGGLGASNYTRAAQKVQACKVGGPRGGVPGKLLGGWAV